MAGELLFRILERSAFEGLPRGGASRKKSTASFLDRGNWSLTQPSGQNYVVIDGSPFLLDAPWIYEGHHTFNEVPIAERETATLLVPSEVVADWRKRLEGLPVGGQVARSSREVRDALMRLMDMVLEDDNLVLTVQSLL